MRINSRVHLLMLFMLIAAAFLFSQGNNTAKGLSEAVGVSEGNLYKWVKRPEWDKALDDLKYTGDRSLHREPRRDIQRDAGELVETAETLYKQSRADGHSEKKAVTFVSNALQMDRRRLNKWRDRFGWEDAYKN